MGYGSYPCLLRPAQSGQVAEMLALPSSGIPNSAYMNNLPYCSTNYRLFPETDSTRFCTPVSNVYYYETYSVYLASINTQAGSLPFTRNWREISLGNFGQVLGTKVGEIHYSDGFWSGYLTHPGEFATGGFWLRAALRSCFPSTVVAMTIGQTENNHTHSVASPAGLPIGGFDLAEFSLGGTWFSDVEGCSGGLDEDAIAWFPSWYYPDGFPSAYLVETTAGNHNLRTGTTFTVDPGCRVYSSGYFLGYKDIFHTQQTTKVCPFGDADVATGFNPLSWRYYANMDGRCGVDDGERAWVFLSPSGSVVAGSTLQIGFGYPWGGITDIDGNPINYYGYPAGLGLFDPTGYRNYAPQSASAVNTDGGVDWLDTTTYYRRPVTISFFNGNPIDSQASGYFDTSIPATVDVSPLF